MKCIRCQNDCKYPQRRNGKCPKCGGQFAFEPRQRDPFTDTAFLNAINAVSADGRMRWGVEHLHYELCRRKRSSKRGSAGCLVLAVLLAVLSVVFSFSNPVALSGLVVAAIVALASFAFRSEYVPLDREKFRGLYDRWVRIHGTPAGVIARNEQPRNSKKLRELEPDVGDYSFDRAVICDRARTVDLLLANNFHFENNCAILSVEGYPSGPFDTVREMLKRNPRLVVYTLHDATPAGCQLAQRLATDPDWFAGWAKVVDVGLRPIHGKHFSGLLLSGSSAGVPAQNGITSWEAAWLSKFALEVAAIRPEQVIKRLFKAMNLPIDPAKYTEDVIYLPSREVQNRGAGGGDGGDVAYVAVFSSDASDDSGPADSFG